MTTPAYNPKEGSLADRVCRFLRINREEELTEQDIAVKFDAARNGVSACLASAIAAGAVVRRRSNDEPHHWVYAAGPKLVSMYPSAAAGVAATGALARKPTRGGNREQLPQLDPATLSVRSDVPLPTVRLPRPPGSSKYDDAFALLKKPGDSVLVPIAYRKALASAARKYCKTHPAVKLTVRTVNDAECGIWRI